MIKLSDSYYYLLCDNELIFYDKIKYYLSNNYKIINTIGLSVELQLNNDIILLSYNKVDYLNKEDLLNKLANICHKHDIQLPNYNKTLLNVISDIKDNFNYPYNKDKLNIINKKYNHIVLLILDGLGVNIINNNLPNSIFNKYKITNLISIFPSTTACATTSIISGLEPIESGWTGWENYIKEINRNVELFTGINYYNREQTGITGYNIMPYNPFFHDMDINGYIIQPNFKIKDNKLSKLLNESINKIKSNNKSIQYVYYTEPDSSMHKLGNTNNTIKNILLEMEKDILNYLSKLNNDTLLIISADHSHINSNEIRLCDNKLLYSYLKRNPSNDSRCITFSVKDEYLLDFKYLFNSLYSNVFDLYTKDEFINNNFIGYNISNKSNRIDDFLADYIAIAKSNYHFNYSNHSTIFKSHHAGYTKDEMIIPLILIEGGNKIED